MAKHGISYEKALENIWLVDSKGLIVKVNQSRFSLNSFYDVI